MIKTEYDLGYEVVGIDQSEVYIRKLKEAEKKKEREIMDKIKDDFIEVSWT